MDDQDAYFVLQTLPEEVTITDFRGHQYKDLKPLDPEDFPQYPKVSARDFLRGLIDVDGSILECRDRRQLILKLQTVASRYETATDSDATNRSEFDQICAARNNTLQLVNLLEETSVVTT